MSAAESSIDQPVATGPARETQPRTSRSVIAIAVGLVAAVVATAVIALVARALGASAAFTPLTAMAYVPLAVIGFLAGLAGWWIIRARARRPAALLRVVVPVVLVLSFIPDVLLLVTGALPGTSLGAVAALAVMHLAIAAAAIPAFQRALPVRD